MKLNNLALLLLAATTLPGCFGGNQSYDTIETFPVAGTVQINGVPARGALIRFWPKQEQAGVKYPITPSGRVDAQGNYQLTSYEGPDGAPPGDYSITITWPDPDWRPPGGGMPPPPPDRLQGKFADQSNAIRDFTVVAGENKVEPIILNDVKILKGSKLPSASH
ncbi:carboxypeptidase regulatory-like domain-containing protein [Bremerella cremea]|uniref:Carboxypeptidase regulatory-like domain-containing protein n=1 Tax=Bremerella cremea TaxID=1031537 RepID=A0A368KNA1_9BACT|nr:carboxypeptidase regulatory-like domain-containing protein [Bremerella cremea]RCS41322.1 carboxypeptidase regulatory-like domain-containing protein [Bremerella cremea]